MKRVAIVQARLNSARFPNKVLADIAGQPMLERVLRRVRFASRLSQTILATANPELAVMAQEWGFPTLVGHPTDVLDRYVKAATAFKADVVIRITGDCPLIDPYVIDQCIDALEEHDYAATVIDRLFVQGLDVEVFPVDVLHRVHRLATSEAHREHVTLFIRDNLPLFDTAEVRAVRGDSALNVSVDTPEDLERVRFIYRECPDNLEHRKWLEAAYGYTSEPVAIAATA